MSDALLAMPHAPPHTAVVSRPSLRETDPAVYLMLSPHGQADWTNDPSTATAFASMREATRMAMRLPSSLRAFSLLRDVEVAFSTSH
jgi:hypothetical protein